MNRQQVVEFWSKELADHSAWLRGEAIEGVSVPEEIAEGATEQERAVKTWVSAIAGGFPCRFGLRSDSFKGKRVASVGTGPLPLALGFEDCEIVVIDPFVNEYIEAGYPLGAWPERVTYRVGDSGKMPSGLSFDVVLWQANEGLLSVFSEVLGLLGEDGKLYVDVAGVEDEGTLVQYFDSCGVKMVKRGELQESTVWSNDASEMITYLVANHNKEEYVAACIESLLTQTSNRWKCVVLDDCSSDGSVDLIRGMVEGDSRFQVVLNDRNLGYNGTLMRLIDLADTDIVGIVDPDDTIHPECTAHVLSKYDQGVWKGFVYTEVFDCDEQMKFVKKGFSRQLPAGKTVLKDNDVVQHVKTFRRVVYYNTPGYVIDEAVYCEDKDLAYKMEEVVRLHHVPKMLYYYRRGTPGAQNAGEKRAIGRKNLKHTRDKAWSRREMTEWKLESRPAFEAHLEAGKGHCTFVTTPSSLEVLRKIVGTVRRQTYPFWRCVVVWPFGKEDKKIEDIAYELHDDQRFQVVDSVEAVGEVPERIDVDETFEDVHRVEAFAKGERTNNVVINSFWTGGELGRLERLSIRTFLDHGHEYRLYTYGDVGEVPEGTRIMDANKILPQDQVFQHARKGAKGSYSTFSNLFRYKLLLEQGGWWVDTDFICLRSFEELDKRDYVFASERDRKSGDRCTTSGVIRVPSGSEFAKTCFERATEKVKDAENLDWGEIGVFMVRHVVGELGLSEHIVDPEVFCPVDWFHWERLIEPNQSFDFGESYAVHFWNEMWRQDGKDKESDYPASSLYMKLVNQRVTPRTKVEPPSAEIKSVPVEPEEPQSVPSEPKLEEPQVVPGKVIPGVLYIHMDKRYPDMWYQRFEHNAKRFGIAHELVCVFQGKTVDYLIGRVKEGDFLLGRFAHADFDLRKVKPIFHRLARAFKGRTFPDSQTYYLYDEKHKQIEFFNRYRVPTPKTELVVDSTQVQEFMDYHELQFPIVFKGVHGASSENVRMAKKLDEITYPAILQEFCPDNEGTVRLTTIGDRVMGYFRPNGKGDFRSASARVVAPVYPSEFDMKAVTLVSEISRKAGFVTMAYDLVKLRGEWVVLEMSYSYPDTGILKAEVCYTRNKNAFFRRSKKDIYPEDLIMCDLFGIEELDVRSE